MSETTTSTLREQHDAARREVLLKGMQDMERESKLPTSAFGEKLDSLRQSYQDSGEAWPESPKWPSNEAVYAHIAERAQKDGGELRGYENIALSNMNLEMKLRTTEAAVDPAVLGDNKEAAIRELITESEALPDDDENKSRQLLSLNNVLVRMQPGAYQPRGDELATFVTNAESYEMQKDRETEGAIAKRFLDSSREELATVIENNEDDLRVLQLLAAKYPAPDRGDAPAATADTEPQDQTAEQQQVPESVTKLRDQQQEASNKLAQLEAKRQKRVLGLDYVGSLNLNKKSREYTALKAERVRLNQELIAEEIRLGMVPNGDVDLYIATRTVDLCKEFDEEIRQNYMKNDGPVGKAINFLTGRNPDGTPDKSTKKLVLRMLVQGGIAAGLAAATIATGGAAAVVVASSAVTGARVYAQGQKIVRNRRVNRTGGILTVEQVKEAMTRTSGLRWNPETGTYEEGKDAEIYSKISAATAREKAAIQRDTVNQKLGNAATVGAGIAAAVFTGSVMHGVLGGNEHHAASATPDTSKIAGIPDPTQHGIPTNPNIYTGPDVTVGRGEGFFSVTERAFGHTISQSDLIKAAPELIKHGYAYATPDGLIGISTPGKMPTEALNILASVMNH